MPMLMELICTICWRLKMVPPVTLAWKPPAQISSVREKMKQDKDDSEISVYTDKEPDNDAAKEEEEATHQS
ncbi:hypothetical protein E2562_029575 [Oryza meyeriana var. granulata]|uniref:Uncharacterized protein n=1 Tax=Oryza meyeriana var. granulata TaxID=110450 RepID=A0A6G1CA61_9ORYZ|nr:hypothetical protein E2562_029575 [Oryza meyeriana var. granulata]